MVAPDVDDWLQIAAEFQSMWDLPHCIGAIDGKHVRIKVRSPLTTMWLVFVNELTLLSLCVPGISTLRFKIPQFQAFPQHDIDGDC